MNLAEQWNWLCNNQVESKRITLFYESKYQRMSQFLGSLPLYTGQKQSQCCLKSNEQNRLTQSSLQYVVDSAVISSRSVNTQIKLMDDKVHTEGSRRNLTHGPGIWSLIRVLPPAPSWMLSKSLCLTGSPCPRSVTWEDKIKSTHKSSSITLWFKTRKGFSIVLSPLDHSLILPNKEKKRFATSFNLFNLQIPPSIPFVPLQGIW